MGIKSGKFEIRKWAIRYYMLKKLIWNIELKNITGKCFKIINAHNLKVDKPN